MYYTVIKHDLRLVFSTFLSCSQMFRRVLSQCNTRLKLLYLLNICNLCKIYWMNCRWSLSVKQSNMKDGAISLFCFSKSLTLFWFTAASSVCFGMIFIFSCCCWLSNSFPVVRKWQTGITYITNTKYGTCIFLSESNQSGLSLSWQERHGSSHIEH